jgi:predicted P-loop ATPase/GTPase
MIILVNGLLPFNSGKTSLVRAILQYALHRGDDFAAMKPMSAHNYWEHYDHSRRCQEMGLLVSRDALDMRDMCSRRPPLEVMNPYHQLVCPLDLARVVKGEEHLVADDYEMVLAERVTDPRTRRSTLYVNRRAEMFIAPSEFLEALRRGADKVEALQRLPAADGSAAVEECKRAAFRELADGWDGLVVESLSDVALPLEVSADEIDLIVSVGGSIVLTFNPGDFLKAADVVNAQLARDLLRYVKPTGTYRVPHLTSWERRDSSLLLEAYQEFLKAMWP